VPVKQQVSASNIVFTVAKARSRQQNLACLPEAKLAAPSGSPGSPGWQALLV